MIYFRQLDGLRKIPLLLAINDDGLAIFRSDLCCKLTGFDFLALKDYVSIERKVTDVRTLMLV